MNQPADIVLNALAGMAFYEQRFANPVAAASSAQSAVVKDVAPQVYIRTLFSRIAQTPAEATNVAARVVRTLLDKWEHCPSPAEVRFLIAECVLAATGTDFTRLHERAKSFLSLPPSTQAQAGEWQNRLIYTCIKRLSRERFSDATKSEWSSVVADAIFCNEPLSEFIVGEHEHVDRKRFNFASLMSEPNER